MQRKDILVTMAVVAGITVGCGGETLLATAVVKRSQMNSVVSGNGQNNSLENDQNMIKIGETVKGNSINMEIIGNIGGRDPIIFVVGGIHQSELTGWRGGSDQTSGWLGLAKEWFLENSTEWSGFKIALVDINPDGRSRVNPNGVNLARNFECVSCRWSKTDPKKRGEADPDGESPVSESESRALINALEKLRLEGEVKLVVMLHNVAPKKGLIDPGNCDMNPESCEIGKRIASYSGARYQEVGLLIKLKVNIQKE